MDVPVISTRIFAVLAATLLVGAFTLATVLPPDLSLTAAIGMLDGGLIERLHQLADDYLAAWVWPRLAVPLLQRPVWLLPAALGIVAAGCAATLASAGATSRSRRRS